MQYAYEDRIAELRARVDRTASRQFARPGASSIKKLDQIMRRQTALEIPRHRARRHSGCIGDRLDPPVRPRRSRRRAVLGTPKPSPISDTVIFVRRRIVKRGWNRARRSPSRRSRTSSPRFGFRQRRGAATDLARSGRAAPDAALGSVEDSMESRVRRMRGVINDLGLDMAQLERATPRPPSAARSCRSSSARTPVPSSANSFASTPTRAQMERLNRTLALGALSQAVIGDVEFTSGLACAAIHSSAGRAMHTGLDFSGRPAIVRATANAKVASWDGWACYGRMVEVDHGNGLSTSTAHLSEINVKRSAILIKIGQVIGASARRPLHRAASALRDPDRRRCGRSAEIFARGVRLSSG